MAQRSNSRIYDPPLGFHFVVRFENLRPATADFKFQSVSGLSMEMLTESHKEGGNNQYDLELPMKSQYADLILKRGLWIRGEDERLEDTSGTLQAWCHRTIQSLIVRPSNVRISLYNPKRDPIMSWWIKGAWPKKWNVSDFNAEENQIVIETIELHYDYFIVRSGTS